MSTNKTPNEPINGTIDWVTADRTTAQYDITDLIGVALDGPGMKALYLYLDMTEFVADVAAWTAFTVSIEIAVDGTNYVLMEADEWSKIELTAEPMAGIYVLKTDKPVKIKVDLDVALAIDAEIPWTGLVTEL